MVDWQQTEDATVAGLVRAAVEPPEAGRGGEEAPTGSWGSAVEEAMAALALEEPEPSAAGRSTAAVAALEEPESTAPVRSMVAVAVPALKEEPMAAGPSMVVAAAELAGWYEAAMAGPRTEQLEWMRSQTRRSSCSSHPRLVQGLEVYLSRAHTRSCTTLAPIYRWS